MNKNQALAYAETIDRVVAALCDLLDFEEGDATDQDLTALAEIAMQLRALAK